MAPGERPTRPITVIVTAVPGAALEGRLAGRVEVVDTGEIVTVATVEDLLALLARLASEDPMRHYVPRP